MTTYVPIHRRKLITSPDVSRGELLLFRLIERLSAGRAGCVRNFATLAEMLERCERQAWTLFGRLVKAGWVAYRTFRKSGKSYFEFWPVVRVAERSAPVFERRARLVKEASESAFSGPKTAPTTALSTPENCTLVEGAYKTLLTPKGGGQQTAPQKTEALAKPETDPVAVSLLENVVSKNEAQELAREAKSKGLSKEQIERVISAYRSQADKVRNRGAWLREAIRRGFAPAAPAATHASDRGERVYPVTKAPAGYALPGSQNVKPGKSEAQSKPEAFQGGEAVRAALREKLRTAKYSTPNTGK